MVTAETALALGALVILTIGLVWVIAVVALQLRCVDAARDGARAAARGEPFAVTQAEARRTAPEGAQVTVRFQDDLVEVEVAVEAKPAWPLLSRLPGVTVRETATVTAEPGVPAKSWGST